MKWKIQVGNISGGGESVRYTAAKEKFQKFSDDKNIKHYMFPSSNGGKEVSTSCVEVYINKFSQDEKIIIRKKFSRKTVLCIASDNSLVYTTSCLLTIESSNFIQGKIPQNHPENTKLGTDGSRKLVGMMQDAFGKDVDFYPIQRSFLASTDDTSLLIIPRKISTHCKDNEMIFSSVHD